MEISSYNRLFLCAVTLVLWILGDTTAQAQSGGVPLWTNRFNGLGDADDKPVAMAVDSDGSIVVTGISYGGTTRTDFATIKYSSDGVPLWTNQYNGPGNWDDGANAIAITSGGNVVVTGYSYGGATRNDYATIMYSSAGIPLWTNRYNGSAYTNDYGKAVAVDASGNVFVTGYSGQTNGSYNNDIVTIAYSNSGVALWTNRYDGPSNAEDQATAIVTDKNGRVFVAGRSGGTGTGYDYVSIAYSNAGLPLWTNRYSGSGTDLTKFIGVNPNGVVVVAGYSIGTNGNRDYVTLAYSNSGEALWTNRYDSPEGSDEWASGAALDTNGNVFVTGWSHVSTFDTELATVAYSAAGTPLWTNRCGCGVVYSNDAAYAIAVDRVGNVFVTGESDYNYVTIAYSNAGVPVWTNRYSGGHGPARGRAIAVDAEGNVFVAGELASTNYFVGASLINNYDFVTIKYSSLIPPPARLDFQRLSNQLILIWTNLGFHLQSAPSATGTFTNNPGATSPYTNAITGAQQFFRLISN